MTKTEIFNLALARLGTIAVADADTDTSLEAVTLRSQWNASYWTTLERMDWNFARKRATLVVSGTTPSFEFDYQYTLPADCLRVRELYDSDAEWQIDGNMFMTNDSEANIIYTAKMTDANLSMAPASFCNALALILASNSAVKLANDSGKIRKEILMELDQLFEPRAMGSDARENTEPERMGSDYWSDR